MALKGTRSVPCVVLVPCAVLLEPRQEVQYRLVPCAVLRVRLYLYHSP
jgi:hypothetical protein